jgi:hypothetical protein
LADASFRRSRKKKAELIESVNAAWLDLSEELFPELPKPVPTPGGETQALPLGE